MAQTEVTTLDQARVESSLESPPSALNQVLSSGHIFKKICSSDIISLLTCLPWLSTELRSVLEVLSG